METYSIAVIATLFGVMIGSFLNVVILRYRTGWGLGGRSKCLSCGKTLQARDLVPILSFVFRKGKCAYCGTKLSLQYPLVEFASGALALMVYMEYAGMTLSVNMLALMFSDLALWWLLLIIAVYDIRHRIIPNGWVMFLSILALAHAILVLIGFFPSPSGSVMFPVMPVWSDLIAGPLLAFPLALLWYISKGKWIGLGDAKLILPLGWYFGVGGGLSIFVLSFWIGALPGIILLCLPRKQFTMKTEIPFAPFIILATLVVYFFGVNILNWTY